jgi:hypothetical protein
MKNREISTYEWDMTELSRSELILIDGGGFWETFGIISGIAVVVAAIVITGGFIAILI